MKQVGPASQLPLMPPYRFGFLDEGLSRGAYPTLRNFRYVSRLRLSTIISLIPEPPSPDLVEFCTAVGITMVHFPIARLAALNAALMSSLMAALSTCLDVDKHSSIYVHCLDGRRITGLFVLVLRRLQGWTPEASFAEYWRVQTTMRPSIPLQEMQKSTQEIAKFLCECNEKIAIPETIPKWLWGGDRSRGFQAMAPVVIRRASDTAAPGVAPAAAATGAISTSVSASVSVSAPVSSSTTTAAATAAASVLAGSSALQHVALTPSALKKLLSSSPVIELHTDKPISQDSILGISSSSSSSSISSISAGVSSINISSTDISGSTSISGSSGVGSSSSGGIGVGVDVSVGIGGRGRGLGGGGGSGGSSGGISNSTRSRLRAHSRAALAFDSGFDSSGGVLLGSAATRTIGSRRKSSRSQSLFGNEYLSISTSTSISSSTSTSSATANTTLSPSSHTHSESPATTSFSTSSTARITTSVGNVVTGVSPSNRPAAGRNRTAVRVPKSLEGLVLAGYDLPELNRFQ